MPNALVPLIRNPTLCAIVPPSLADNAAGYLNTGGTQKAQKRRWRGRTQNAAEREGQVPYRSGPERKGNDLETPALPEAVPPPQMALAPPNVPVGCFCVLLRRREAPFCAFCVSLLLNRPAAKCPPGRALQ